MDPTPVPDVPNLDWWNQLRKQEQQNAPNKPPAPAPGSPQAMSSALMGGQDPYENMHGTGPQGNVANSALSDISSALLRTREGISGQTQPSAEDLASGKVKIPSWQSAIPQAVGLGMQGQGMGGALEGAALHLVPRVEVSKNSSLESMGPSVFKQLIGGNREYSIYNDQKNLVGDLNAQSHSPFGGLEDRGGNIEGHAPGTVYVNTISGVGSNKLGPKETVSLLSELKREYPDMTTLAGDRVTGARKGNWAMNKLAKMDVPDKIAPSASYPKPEIVQPWSSKDYNAVNAYSKMIERANPNNFLTSHFKDINGNIHLYGPDFKYLDTIPAEKIK